MEFKQLNFLNFDDSSLDSVKIKLRFYEVIFKMHLIKLTIPHINCGLKGHRIRLILFVYKSIVYNMRKVKDNPDWKLPKTRRTDFTKEEMLDIIDFYLQYKPMLDEYVSNREHYPEFDPGDFTKLLFMYEMFDVDYADSMVEMKEKYGKKYVKDLSEEKLDFLEIITVFTFIQRAERHAGEGWYEDCIADDTFYNLLSRLEEIKNELASE